MASHAPSSRAITDVADECSVIATSMRNTTYLEVIGLMRECIISVRNNVCLRAVERVLRLLRIRRSSSRERQLLGLAVITSRQCGGVIGVALGAGGHK
jgi:hypothetical protein